MNARHGYLTLAMSLLAMPLMAFAGVAETSATAGSNGRGNGTAGATATYDGDGIGLTRTKASSGRLNIARGLSVGLDADGLSVSNSFAVAGRFGPAIGRTFSLHISPNGTTSLSSGSANAEGSNNRSVAVGSSAGAVYGTPVANASASGSTGSRGRVQAVTNTETSRGHKVAPRVTRRSRLR
ncbi:MAG: hypothetical protein H6817_01575 [Phycisphaerales bacterium]|nr:hypothetical protein [Phycisphaerales bacterium]